MTPSISSTTDATGRAEAPDQGSLARAACVEEARKRLLGIRQSGAGWGYRPGTETSVEPTALACLGMMASDPDPTHDSVTALGAADWLASIQNPDGSLGVSRKIAAPCWTTPYAILLWD